MGASFGLAFFGAEELLHWALQHPNLRWGQILQILPAYVGVCALLGAVLGAVGFRSLAGALWLWGGFTGLMLAGQGLASMGWAGVPFALFGMVAVVVVILFLTRERGDEYRWGALMGGWAVTLFGVVLNTSRLGAFLHPVTIGVNLGVVIIGAAMAVAIAKALGPRKPRIGVWALLVGVLFWAARAGLPNPVAIDMPQAPQKAKNIKQGVPVLVVLIDGLRADHVGFMSDGDSLTPNLDALASKSIVYADTQAAAPWGMPALASALTGLVPSEHEAQVHGALGADKRTLGEYLSEEADYTTGMVVSNPEYKPGCGLDQGFSWYKQVTGLGHEPTLLAFTDMLGLPLLPERDWPRAERVIENVLQFIDTRKGTRWLAIAQFSDLRTEDPAAYASALQALDAELGRLRARMDKETWIIVMGTHGNALGHEGGQQALWQGNLHVPTVVFRPFNLRPATVTRPVSTADLTPTLLWVTESGVRPRIRLEGRYLDEAVGLPSPDEHSAVIAQGPSGTAVRRDEWKLLAEDRDRLFNVVLDPSEERDLAPMEVQRARELGWSVPGRERPPEPPEPPSEEEGQPEAPSPADGTPPGGPAEPG